MQLAPDFEVPVAIPYRGHLRGNLVLDQLLRGHRLASRACERRRARGNHRERATKRDEHAPNYMLCPSQHWIHTVILAVPALHLRQSCNPERNVSKGTARRQSALTCSRAKA